MQNDNKMEWWLSFVSVLVVITAIITLAFSVTAFMIAGNAGKSAEQAAESIQEVARDISITVKSDPVILRSSGNGGSTGNTDKTADEKQVIAEESDTAPQNTALYILREYNGKIGVFSADGGLLKTVSVMVSSLPAQDKTALAAGISVSSYEELHALLEDFS